MMYPVNNTYITAEYAARILRFIKTMRGCFKALINKMKSAKDIYENNLITSSPNAHIDVRVFLMPLEGYAGNPKGF